jgi:DNA modification methylase
MRSLRRESQAAVSARDSVLDKHLNRVILGDCCVVMQQLPSSSVDLIVTDPPYLVNYHSRDGRTIAGDTDDAWLLPAFTEAYRVLRPGGFCVSFYCWAKVDKVLQAWKSAGFSLVEHLVWLKLYVSRSGFLEYGYDHAYILATGKGRPLPDIDDIQYFQYVGGHLDPSLKPVEGLKRLIRAFSEPADVVLDPFCGNGNVPLAAKLTNRRYVGIELRQDYCEIAQHRLMGQEEQD